MLTTLISLRLVSLSQSVFQYLLKADRRSVQNVKEWLNLSGELLQIECEVMGQRSRAFLVHRIPKRE